LLKGGKRRYFLTTSFLIAFLISGLALNGILANNASEGRERISAAMIHTASATSDGGGGDGDGDQGGGDGDQGGETDGSADFQPDSDTDETETAGEETETTDEETEPEPTPQLDVTPEPSPTPQELVEICDNGQDDDNDGQADETDSDCATQPSSTPSPTPGPLQGVFAVPEPDCIVGGPNPRNPTVPACDDPSVAQFLKTCSTVPRDAIDGGGFEQQCVVDRTQCANTDAVVTNVGCHVFTGTTTTALTPTPSPIPGPLPTPGPTRSPIPGPLPTPGPTRSPIPGLVATPDFAATPMPGLFQTIAPEKSCRPVGVPGSPIPECSLSDRLGACQDIGLIGSICKVLPPDSPTPPPKRTGVQCSVATIPGATLPLCIDLPGDRVADCVNISIGTVCTALSPTPTPTPTPIDPNIALCILNPNSPNCPKTPSPTPSPTPTPTPLLDLVISPSPGPSPSPSPSPSPTPSPTPIIITNVNNNQVTVRNDGGYTVQNTAGAVTATPDCPPQSATVVLGPSPMQNSGARILAALDPCILTDGTVILNLPDEKGIQLVAANIQGGQTTQSVVVPMQRIAPITEGQTLYNVDLNGQITGTDPATGNPVTLNGNINALFLRNNGGQDVELNGDNSVALNAILRK
jgi:hypothetical protein